MRTSLKKEFLNLKSLRQFADFEPGEADEYFFLEIGDKYRVVIDDMGIYVDDMVNDYDDDPLTFIDNYNYFMNRTEKTRKKNFSAEEWKNLEDLVNLFKNLEKAKMIEYVAF